MTPFPESAELPALLNALCEGAITAEQMRRLEALVLASPEAEAFYVQYMSLHADLAGHFGALPIPTEQSLRERAEAPRSESTLLPVAAPTAATVPSPTWRRYRPYLWGALGLTGVAAGLLLALLPAKQPTGSVSIRKPQEPTDRTVAVLVQAPGAVWNETGMPTRPGSPLPIGLLHLKSGVAHIEFYNGAMVILEGPEAKLQLISRTEARCLRGQLRATVPPQAQGFTITSPKFDLVDRGTEFGLRVDESEATEVHVFQGKVEVFDAGSNRKTATPKDLTTGQAVQWSGAGPTRAIASNSAAFLTAEKLAARSKAELLLRQKSWEAARHELQRDESLLVYYSFQPDKPWSRTLTDEADGRRQPHDGAIVGCTWTPGRWTGKEGLEFKRVSDRVRFHAPGEFDSLTMMAWVRVDALPNLNNSLMMTDGWEPGGCHWQIGNSGTIILGVQSKPKSRGAHYHAPETLTPERFGQWIHLAVVYDKENQVVTHYVDGQPAARERIQFDIPLRLGDTELGNWNIAMHRNGSPIRNFNGCMDEFLLFSRALPEEEIAARHAQGRPPS